VVWHNGCHVCWLERESINNLLYIMSELNIKTELTPFPGMRKGHNLFIYGHILFYFKVINENLQNFEYFTEF